MTTIVAAAIAALFKKTRGQNHQAVFKIIINAFNEFFRSRVFTFVFSFHKIFKLPIKRAFCRFVNRQKFLVAFCA